MIKILVSPFKFLSVTYPGGTALAWILPLIFATITVISSYSLDIDIPISGDDGILRAGIGLFTISGGFYVAILAVFAANGDKMLNSYFVGEQKPHIKGEIDGLTRKRFLALLFGYLSFISFSLVAISSVLIIYKDAYKSMEPGIIKDFAPYALGYIGSFLAFQLFLLSLVGLYYLTDRLHRPDGRSNFGSRPPPSE